MDGLLGCQVLGYRPGRKTTDLRRARLTLGQAVRDRRKELGLSRADLSVAAKVGYDTIVKLELDRRKPSFDRVVRIAKVLDLSLDELGAITGALLARAS